MEADITEEELCINLIRHIVGVLKPHGFVARIRKAPYTACAMRSSVVKNRG
jgi:predicted RNase H-related nuclease YkuK (DUF458 family)